jgi:ferric-dicitrate binding protein FerR (iron transport regulator)
MKNRNIISTQERIISRDPLQAYEKVMRRVRLKNTARWIGRTGVAAICVASICLWLFPVSNIPVLKQQLITVESKSGMRTSFQLPDSTIVYLNSGSKLSYPIPFDKKERRLELSGEAYFKVKHDSKAPFLVEMLNKELTIKVLGTEFNVEAYREDKIINTTLIHGSLQIEGKTADGKILERILVPSEKATYFREDGRLDVKTVDIVCDTGWMEGKIILKNTSLSEMLRKLTHHYNVDFIVEDPVLETYLFTGVFDNRTLSQVLDYLEISSDIDYKISISSKDDSESINREKVTLRKRKYAVRSNNY